jgi:hypothetical protein
MLQATVSIDAGAPRGILATLSAPVLNEVAARALNDTAKNAQVAAVQQLTPMMGLLVENHPRRRSPSRRRAPPRWRPIS